jgi:hypothetical protein
MLRGFCESSVIDAADLLRKLATRPLLMSSLLGMTCDDARMSTVNLDCNMVAALSTPATLIDAVRFRSDIKFTKLKPFYLTKTIVSSLPLAY